MPHQVIPSTLPRSFCAAWHGAGSLSASAATRACGGFKVRDDVTRRGQKAPHTLYVLDEPTVSLHMADLEKPMWVRLDTHTGPVLARS